MNPRRRSPPSSLELLLDTVCNTFGCIIFMTILIAISVQNSSQRLIDSAKGYISPVEASELQAKWEEVQSRYNQLKKDREGLEGVISQLVPPEAVEMIQEIQDLENQFKDLQNQREELVRRIAEAENRKGKIETQKEEIEKQLQWAEKELADLEAKLDQEKKKRTQTTRLPKERISSKRPITFVIRFGRLYMWFRCDREGNWVGLNTDEFVVVEETEQEILTTPKPHAGIPIDAPNAKAQIAARLRPFPPETFYINCAIWADSFESFQKFKQIIVQKGYEYRLILVAEGEKVKTGPVTPFVQ